MRRDLEHSSDPFGHLPPALRAERDEFLRTLDVDGATAALVAAERDAVLTTTTDRPTYGRPTDRPLPAIGPVVWTGIEYRTRADGLAWWQAVNRHNRAAVVVTEHRPSIEVRDEYLASVAAHTREQFVYGRYDGGAWLIRPGDPDEQIAADWVYLPSVVAQPADVRSTLRSSVQWKPDGTSRATARTFTDGGAFSDHGHRARQCAKAWTADDGTNGTHNGERVHWRTLTAEGAAWLHAVKGTPMGANLVTGDAQRIVGAIPTAPRATRTERAIATTWEVRYRDAYGLLRRRYVNRVQGLIETDDAGVKHWRSSTTWIGDDAGQHSHPQPHTSRIVSRRLDQRTGDGRTVGRITQLVIGAATQSAMRKRERLTEARIAAIAAVSVLDVGRFDRRSLPYRLLAPTAAVHAVECLWLGGSLASVRLTVERMADAQS